jgi:hypothetical protein
MKTINSFLLLLLFLCISCTSNEDQVTSNSTTTILANNRVSNGTRFNAPNCALTRPWKLVHLYGGFAGFDENYTPGAITWKLNYANQSFKVLNTISNTPSGGYLPSGTYPCSIVLNPNGTFCFEYYQLQGCSNFNSNQLGLSENVGADGIGLNFIQ